MERRDEKWKNIYEHRMHRRNIEQIYDNEPGIVPMCTTYVYKYSLLMHCIKIKSPAKFLLNEQYVFVGGNISFLCVLSCSSEEA